MWHTLFIAVHASAGGIALLAGCLSLGRRAMFGTYLWSLVAMAAFLALAVASEWGSLAPAARALFVAFVLLALVMVWCGDQARRIRPREGVATSAAYVAHLGFTLVALFDAFIVILVLNLGSPGWLIATAGVLIALVGHVVLGVVRDRLVGPAPTLPGNPPSLPAPVVRGTPDTGGGRRIP